MKTIQGLNGSAKDSATEASVANQHNNIPPIFVPLFFVVANIVT